MRSSRAREHQPSDPNGTSPGSRKWRILYFLCGAATLVIVIVLAIQLTQESPKEAASLDLPRKLLVLAPDLPQQELRIEAGRRAEFALNEYLQDTAATETEAASLLLLTSKVLQDEFSEAPEALQDRLQSLPLDEIRTEDLITASTILFGKKHFGQADFVITSALKRKDHRSEVLRVASTIRYDIGREEDLLDHCEELAELSPEDPSPWLGMAFVYEDRGDHEQLSRVMREVISRTPPEANSRHQLKLVECLVHLGQSSEARAILDDVREKKPEIITSFPIVEASLLELEGENERALAIVDSILEREPENSSALMIKGRMSLTRADWESARVALRKVIEQEPTNVQAHYHIGQVYARSGEVELAKRHLKLHQELLDKKVRLHRLERQAARAPRDVQVRETIASLYEEIGMSDLAQFWQDAAESAKSLGVEDSQ